VNRAEEGHIESTDREEISEPRRTEGMVCQNVFRDIFLAIGRLAQRKVHYSRVKFCKIVWYAIFYVKSKHITKTHLTTNTFTRRTHFEHDVRERERERERECERAV